MFQSSLFACVVYSLIGINSILMREIIKVVEVTTASALILSVRNLFKDDHVVTRRTFSSFSGLIVAFEKKLPWRKLNKIHWLI
jgi:hypothetical protein